MPKGLKPKLTGKGVDVFLVNENPDNRGKIRKLEQILLILFCSILHDIISLDENIDFFFTNVTEY